MSDINVTMQIADVITETAKLLNLTAAQKKAWQDTAVATVKYDEALNKYITTVKGSVDANKQLTATFENAGEKGARLLTAQVRELSAEIEKNKKAQQAVAQATKLAEQVSKAREQQLTREAAAEAKLNEAMAKRAAKTAQEARTQILASTIGASTAAESARLKGLGVDLGPQAQGRLFAIGRSIAEMGAKAGLTARQLQDMFAAVGRGDFAGIESKYAGVVSAILRYNSALQSEREKLAKTVQISGKGGKAPEFPTPNLDKFLQFQNILSRIQGTLTNLAIYRGFNFLTNQITEAISAARQYQMQVALVRTISQDANLSTGQWTRGLRDVSNTLAVDFKDAASAAYNAVSAQIVQGQATFQYLKDVGELARTTGTTLSQSQDVVSGVINSYKMSASDATEISAKLFRTIDLGNVVLPELAGTIGRVTALGNDLGVSFDEVLATLSTFTRNGVKTADAMTFLNNVFTKLLAPTEKMRGVLDRLGISSVEATIKAGNYRQVLGQLIGEVQKGNVDAIELFPEIRGAKGFAAYQQNLKEFDRDLKQIGQNSSKYFDNAKNIISETDADRINRTMTVLKNTLTSNIGDRVNSLIAGFVGISKTGEELSETTARVEKAVASLIQKFITGGVALGTFVVGMRALGVIVELNAARAYRAALANEAEAAAKIKNTAATNTLSVAEGRLAVAKKAGMGALIGGNPIASAAVLGLTAFSAYQAFQATSQDTFASANEAFGDFMKRIKEGEAKKELEKQLSVIDNMRDSFKGITTEVSGKLQEALAANNKRIGEINEKLKETQDRLKIAFVGSLDASKDKLREIEQQIQAINEASRNSGRRGSDFRESLFQNALGTANKFANPQQQLQILSNEFNRVRNQISSLIAQATPEALAEAEKLYDKLGTLSTQFYEKQGDLQKQQFEEGIRQQVAEGSLPGGNYTFFFDQTQQLKTNAELENLRNTMIARGNAMLQQRKQLLEQEKIRQEQDVKAREMRIKQFEEFDINKFKDKDGKFNPDQANTVFNNLAAQLAKDVGPDVLKRLELGQIIEQRRQLYAEQIKRAAVGQDLTKSQKDLGKATEDAGRAFADANKSQTAYNQGVEQLVANNRALLEVLKAVAAASPDAIVDTRQTKKLFGMTVPDVLGAAGDTNAAKTKERFTPILSELTKAEEELKNLKNNKIIQNGIEIVDPEAVKRAVQRVRDAQFKLRIELEGAAKDYGLGINPTDKLPGTKGFNLNDLTRSQEEIEADKDKLLKSQMEGAASIERAKKALEEIQKSNSALNALAAEQQKVLGQNQGGLDTLTQRQLANYEALRLKIEEVIRASQRLGGGAPAPVQTKSYGGAVYRAYGGPIGTDNVPAWLSDGEIVANQAASNRFYSQIMSMNNTARVPQYFNKGGMVTNDNSVSFTINESKNPQATARAVDALMRRSRRLGNT